MSNWWFWLVQFSRRLLVRAAAYGAFAVLAALAAVWFAPFVPSELSERLGGEAVEGLLTALASSMLAVSTFSLSAMVVAYTAASAQMTPRAAAFVTNDGATQRALATFVGAFLFTVVALVALGANYYGAEGRTILFLATLLMVLIVAVTLIGWIDRLARLAQHGHVLKQVEEAARKALCTRCERRFMGGSELLEVSADGVRVPAVRTDYVANIDPSMLQKLAERIDGTIEVLVDPGDFVVTGTPLVNIVGAAASDDAIRNEARDAFAFRDARTFEQDPLYGVEVLVEIAARALSPGVNDPGTAILVVDACYRVLEDWLREENQPAPACAYDRVRARHIDGCDMVERSLGEVARYGAKDVAVAVRAQTAFATLAASNSGDFAACVRKQAALALARAEQVLEFEADRERVRAAARG